MKDTISIFLWLLRDCVWSGDYLNLNKAWRS